MSAGQRLSDRAAIVTGAGQGIGRAISAALAAEGARVVLVDQAADRVHEAADALAADGGTVRSVVGSVSDRATADGAVAASVEAFGGVDVVVNCAHTYTPHASLETIPEQDFLTELDTGLLGTVRFMQAAFEPMRAQGRGSIINFGSQVALHGDHSRATYVATKEAIRGLSRTAARDWGRHKIRVNVICPMALTPAVKERVASDVLQAAIDGTALGYIADPPEVAAVAVFLAGDDARYVTGQTINVDGGAWMF